jgi:uncharacterized protein (DUF433 family)
MADFPRITKDPHVMGGKACVRDTHVTVSALVALLATGRHKEEVIRMLPSLTLDDLNEVLAYAAWWIDEPQPPQSALPSGPAIFPRTGPAPWPKTKLLSAPAMQPPMAASVSSLSITTNAPVVESVTAREVTQEESDDDRDFESAVSPLPEESLELYHPAYPDQPTVVITRHGLYDRRWSTNILAWSDIQEIERISGHKNINIILRNPEYYLDSMPFFKRCAAKFKLALNMQTFYLDTASLGIRTKDLYFAANRLWHLHRGKVRFRKKRRVRIGKRSSRDSYWQKTLPR